MEYFIGVADLTLFCVIWGDLGFLQFSLVNLIVQEWVDLNALSGLTGVLTRLLFYPTCGVVYDLIPSTTSAFWDPAKSPVLIYRVLWAKIDWHTKLLESDRVVAVDSRYW